MVCDVGIRPPNPIISCHECPPTIIIQVKFVFAYVVCVCVKCVRVVRVRRPWQINYTSLLNEWMNRRSRVFGCLSAHRPDLWVNARCPQCGRFQFAFNLWLRILFFIVCAVTIRFGIILAIIRRPLLSNAIAESSSFVYVWRATPPAF